MSSAANFPPQIMITTADNTEQPLSNSSSSQSAQQAKPAMPGDPARPRSERPASIGLNINHRISRSPSRSPDTHLFTTQRLRNPSFSNTQRRTSLNGPHDLKGFSWSSMSSNATNLSNPSTGSAKTAIYPPVTSRSSRGSPRSSQADYTYSSSNLASTRRHSDLLPRKPSTAEVFDLMEREQDAIVLKLIKEITQLKEDNRQLVNTINQLTNNSYVSRSRKGSSAFNDHSELTNIQQLDPKLKEGKFCR